VALCEASDTPHNPRCDKEAGPSPDVEALKRRVFVDAIGILAGTILGYRLFVDFIRTEGLATVRMQTERALARGIQATLVPSRCDTIVAHCFR
jgi:hypothetical protein